MANKAKLLTLIMTMALLSGCAGDSDDGDYEDGGTEGPSWINDVGSETPWSISLESTEWLEVKSAAQILETQEDNETMRLQVGMMIIHDENWSISGSDEYSPIFGGNYTSCVWYDDGICYQSHPSINWSSIEWTVIYRIHEV